MDDVDSQLFRQDDSGDGEDKSDDIAFDMSAITSKRDTSTNQ